jgi:hypothetical protein
MGAAGGLQDLVRNLNLNFVSVPFSLRKLLLKPLYPRGCGSDWVDVTDLTSPHERIETWVSREMGREQTCVCAATRQALYACHSVPLPPPM